MIAMAPVVPFTIPPSWLQVGPDAQLPSAHRAGRWRTPRGIILDLDDTLYPRQRFVQSGFGAVSAYVARTFAIAADDAFTLLSECAARGEQATAFQSLCARFGLDHAVVPVLVDVFRSHEPNIFLGRGAKDMLRTLRADGWRTAVLTNGLPEVQARKVKALGLDQFVDLVIYAEHVATGGKPAQATFRAALRRLGTRADRTVCLGDDPRSDVAGARAAGMSTIRLAVAGVEVESALDADIVVDILTDVPRAAVTLLEGVTRHVA